MNVYPEFRPFPKLARLKRTITVTEKLDGTNAQVVVTPSGDVLAGSRTRWITPEDDNYGFAKWVRDNQEQLRLLGPGQHFGEWWGSGIQRRYDMPFRRFSLFSVERWEDTASRPACVDVVPVLYRGDFTTNAIDDSLERLRRLGSHAAPGFMNPEGVVVYHHASRQMFKVTLNHNDQHKGVAA